MKTQKMICLSAFALMTAACGENQTSNQSTATESDAPASQAATSTETQNFQDLTSIKATMWGSCYMSTADRSVWYVQKAEPLEVSLDFGDLKTDMTTDFADKVQKNFGDEVGDTGTLPSCFLDSTKKAVEAKVSRYVEMARQPGQPIRTID